MKHSTFTLIFIYILALSTAVSKAYTSLSPYQYCAGDPVNFTDPTGCIVRAVYKSDAKMAVSDFRAMFPGEEFTNFRNLITQSGEKHNGNTFAPISEITLSEAFEGVTLSEDQQALVELVVNTINSEYIHTVEYIRTGKEMSPAALKIFTGKLQLNGVTPQMAAQKEDGYLGYLRELCGDAATAQLENGSFTLIYKNPLSVTNRPATLGHEIIGHGRSYQLGFTDDQSQHVLPIQIENLILRNMGILMYRDGHDHGPQIVIPNATALPSFR